MLRRWMRFAVVCVCAVGWASPAAAADVELFAGAGTILPDDSTFEGVGVAWTAGVAVPVLNPSVAVQVEYTGAHARHARGGTVDLVNLGVGPRVRGTLFDGQLRPHGEFLVSWMRVANDPVGARRDTSDHVGVKFGGGVEIALTDTIALDLAAHYLTAVTDDPTFQAIATTAAVRVGF